jgi:DNA-binding transcriptional LysR family regulator
MRDFDALDSGSFRPFYFAAETLNFTEAARRAGLTQSGISQHVAKMEQQIGVPLFLRVNKRVILTDAGKRLKAHIERYLDDVASLKDTLRQGQAVLKGIVSYAMPASCLMTPHFPLLLARREKSFPGVELRVTICPTPEVIDRLLAGEIDFGFVTKHTGHPALRFIHFCQEEYVLISRDKLRFDALTELRMLDHPGADVLFEHWRAKHLPKSKLQWQSLNLVGRINSLEGVIKMVEGGLGATIIPRHCIAGKRLFEYGGKRSLNDIHIATRAQDRLPRRVQTVIDTFLAMMKKK